MIRMTNTQAVQLCAVAKKCCPQQAIDEETADLWWPLLNDLTYADAAEALLAVVRKQPFVAPAEIRAEARRIRNARLSRFGPIPDPPAEVAARGDAAERAWFADTTRRVADGEVTTREELGILPSPPATKPRELNASTLFRPPPADETYTGPTKAQLRDQALEAEARYRRKVKAEVRAEVERELAEEAAHAEEPAEDQPEESV